ncbi:transcriptional regulator, XRE family [Dethiosulfovibrio peptidovorans DSM 11002]|uniref:Transcriptional regulator, XRE family n=1 Tax=Dethiosulfovibrio peptidovorans DSM 11002 TaxID=469381 RepID=D2Z3U7_9BACT|nr:helix-turn-helix transcriptional regulator [Dethiosulfovibrio peptidovorans]EFC90403.1 transcriptional regulator, XRE family [Dethiosulfovibrio peptidovorans DSM 11002]
MRYGEVIQKARKGGGFSQEELAIRVGVVRTTIGAWETEKFPPTDAKKIAALERNLNLPLGSLYRLLVVDGEGWEPEASILEATDRDPSLKEIQHRLSNLVRTIGELYERCDSPEEVMNLLLDVGEDGRINNHPKNEAFMDLLEALVPLAGEVLKAVKHGKEDLS